MCSAKIKTRPNRQKKDLSSQKFIPKGNTTISRLISILTISRLISILKKYTNVDPIEPSYSVGSLLLPDLDKLAADINKEWKLPDGKGFWPGEIESEWTVEYLAGYIHAKVVAAQ